MQLVRVDRKYLSFGLSTILTCAIVLSLSSMAVSSASANGGTDWTKYSENPLSDLGDGVSTPCVIYDDGTYKMWYAKGDSTYYATSPDGVHWSVYGTVLSPGGSGSWDRRGALVSSVLLNGDTYEMWYVSLDPGGQPFGIFGYATSTNGIDWTKHPDNPVLVPGNNGGWDDWNINMPKVVFDGSKYWMWYTGQSDFGSTQKIGLATSTDGAEWTKYSGNPVMGPGSGWDSLHVYPGGVIKEGSTFKMWYWAQDGDRGRIGLATSSDGIAWTRYSGNPVLDLGESGSWDSKYVMNAWVVRVGSGYLMWYNGNDGDTNRIGLAYTGEVRVDIDPDTLNLNSEGEWVTVYIEVPWFDVEDIDVSTVTLEGIPAEEDLTEVGDYDDDGIPDLMVKISREALITYLVDAGVQDGDSVELTVTWELSDGTEFEGTDTIRVVKKGKK